MGEGKEGFEDFLRANKGPVLFLIVLIAIIGALAGYKYYMYTQERPEFCSSCHLMQEAVKSWQRSSHKRFPCQICHKMSIVEQNKLLIAFVVKTGKGVFQKHGKISPWLGCKDCHMDSAAQGAIMMRNSYGHARHIFMQDIGCNKCHNGHLHVFDVSRRNCISCHKEKLVHGMGMKGLECLNCHSFSSGSPKLIATDRCVKCHEYLSGNRPMAGLKCFECHKPHGKLAIESKDCLGFCHGNENKVGQHGLHITKAGLECLDCHKPHTWRVGKSRAGGLCDRCHERKNPVRFIY